MQLTAIHFVITLKCGSFWLYLLLSNTIWLFLDHVRFTPHRFQMKCRILVYCNQTLYLIERIILVLGPQRVLRPPRVLGPHWVLGPNRVLGPQMVLGPHGALGSHRVLGPPRVLGSYRVLDPVFRYAKNSEYNSLSQRFKRETKVWCSIKSNTAIK